MQKFLSALFLSAVLSFSLQAQNDTGSVDDFDISAFELAAPAAKSFCTNKVLGQSPTALLGVYYDHQLGHDFTPGNVVGAPASETDIEAANNFERAQGYSFVGNFPLLSRNNILINMNLIYQDQRYTSTAGNLHPLTQNLVDRGLRRSAALFTIFKPLNDKTFILGQLGVEYNGDYLFSDMQSASTLRIPAALLYGWKPNDYLMWGLGLSRTYLGGALNYVPVVYYYKTFQNEKWGIEALLPARASLRYRPNVRSLFALGWNVNGATYRLNGFPGAAANYAQNNVGNFSELTAAREVELRRSEIRVGLNYSRQISGFFWLSAEAGYRINYSYELDQGGDFTRFWGSDEPFFIENDLANPLYFTVGLLYVSP